MITIGNILWLVTGGLLNAFWWFLWGILWHLTIVGIPFGRQCFKFAALSLAPFGKDVIPGGGVPSLVANILWLFTSGIPMAMSHILCGCLLCLTVVGIPFGTQHFKIARLALYPFGARVVRI